MITEDAELVYLYRYMESKCVQDRMLFIGLPTTGCAGKVSWTTGHHKLTNVEILNKPVKSLGNVRMDGWNMF